MNPRTLRVLEYDKVLAKVAQQCAFSGGAEIARGLLPSDDLDTIRDWLEETAEAAKLLEQKTDIGFGGARDVRGSLDKAERRAMLLPLDLLEIKNTLIRARSLRNTLTRLEHTFPRLADIAHGIEPCDHVVSEIGRCVNDRAEIADAASSELSRIRQELRTAQERLLSTLDRLVRGDVAQYLQDSLVTQRQGRYVIPVRAEYKAQVDGIVHDQSASGATLFIEPIKVVQQNNAVREWELQEEKEVRRILTELSELVADEATYIRNNVHVLARLDFTFAKAKYAYAIEAVKPEVLPFRAVKRPSHQGKDEPAVNHPGSAIDFRRARHPLLDPEMVVPIHVYLDDETYIVVITGPNTGGKTVTLKTVGLLTLMAQSGLMIPAEPGSRLSIFEGIYADIGDEQSIEQNLSTFSSHMTHIITILEEADPRSLVLLDELGAGTDPDEGSALAMALLENLRDRGITTFATTHYSDLKLYAHNTPGVVNASVEFDVETLSPTYELSIGLPGRSNALTIAGRLGLNPVIVEHAEKIVRPDTLQADALLDDIRRAKQETLRAEERARARARQSQLLERDLRYQLAEIEETRRKVIADARDLMAGEIDAVREEMKEVRRQLAREGDFSDTSHSSFLAKAEAELSRRRAAEEAVNRDVIVPGAPEEQIVGVIEEGDRVWVPSLQASGEVVALHKKSQEADVQLGNFRLKLPLKRMELRQKAEPQTAPAAPTNYRGGGDHPSPGMELDIRGQRVEEGLEQVERYLDDAYMARLPFVRIIHGKGTGVLRDAVRDVVRRHALVSEARPGKPGEGDDGVTVVKLIEA
ncbi:MAG: endonuclease MutS2 [Caldilineaceae bacterium]|nr:endonuclease MutS2 [Caldilineaceae bacterium]